ncbi:MAG: hypothetical protein JO290_06735 [Sphingomonadaceae bacterium]|nr:hypothetical protein [Sphingomonadaceae bacterium]
MNPAVCAAFDELTDSIVGRWIMASSTRRYAAPLSPSGVMLSGAASINLGQKMVWSNGAGGSLADDWRAVDSDMKKAIRTVGMASRPPDEHQNGRREVAVLEGDAT